MKNKKIFRLVIGVIWIIMSIINFIVYAKPIYSGIYLVVGLIFLLSGLKTIRSGL